MKLRIILPAIILLAAAYTGRAQTAADYDTAVNKFQRFYNNGSNDSIFNMLSKKIQAAMPFDKTDNKFKELSSQLGAMLSHKRMGEKDSLVFYKTVFTYNNMTLTLAVHMDAQNKLETFRFIPYNPDTVNNHKGAKSNFILGTRNGNIYGTLALPSGTQKVPIVMIIPGSGPIDRDGNSPLGINTNTYKMIADSLLKEGIGSLRYDKRGIGESDEALKGEDSLSFDDAANDAAGFLKLLNKYYRSSAVIVLGHSEGSLLGMLAIEKEPVAGFISVAGVAQRADKIIEKQLEAQPDIPAEKAKIILDSLVDGYTVKNIDASLITLFRPSIQNYMRSWLKYTPREEIKKLDMPVLILQGTTDIQVPVSEAKKLKKADRHATLTIIDGMNHVLKQAPEDRTKNMLTYMDPSLPLSPELMPAIVDFVKGIK